MTTEPKDVEALVERLRDMQMIEDHPGLAELYAEAAAEITRLRARVEESEGALEPFAREADDWPDKMDCEDLPADATGIKIADLRAARAALNPKDNRDG